MSDNYELRWEVAGAVQLSRTFTRLGAVLRDFRRPLRRLAREVIYPEIKHQFETEGNPAWPPLSPGYARRKALKYPGRPKLVASGALRKSLVNRNATGSIYTLTKEYLEIGTSLKTPNKRWNLGLIHQLGAPRAKVPARPMLRLRPEAQTQAVVIFHEWFREQGRRLGINAE